MTIRKENLKEVKVNVDDENIINLLNEWCMDDYHIFGGMLNMLTKIGERIILLKYNKKNNSFLTFDKNANPLDIKLIIDKDNDEQRKINIDKYGNIREYLYSQVDNNIYITEVIKKQNENSKIKIRKK